MTRRSLLASVALLCALTVPALAQTTTASQATDLGAADPAATTHFTVYFPLTHQDKLEQLVNDQTNSSSPSYHQWLTPAQFATQFGPNPGDVARVTRRLEQAGFTVTAQHTQSIEVTGPVAAVETLFSTRLNQVKLHHSGKIRLSAARHPLTLPAELAAAGVVIPSFYPELSATRPLRQGERLHQRGRRAARRHPERLPSQRLSTSYLIYYPDDLNEAYSFPSFTTQAGPSSVPRRSRSPASAHTSASSSTPSSAPPTSTPASTPRSTSVPTSTSRTTPPSPTFPSPPSPSVL